MYWQTLFVICCFVLSSAEEYRKLWHQDHSESVIDAKNAPVVIQPSSFTNQFTREPREPTVPYTYRRNARYAFKPRAIPIRDEPQVERSSLYADVLKNKTDILFPGNYLPIAKEKSSASDGQFHAKAIPLIRSDEYQRRSLDVDEPIIEKPEGFSEEPASRRSLSCKY